MHGGHKVGGSTTLGEFFEPRKLSGHGVAEEDFLGIEGLSGIVEEGEKLEGINARVDRFEGGRRRSGGGGRFVGSERRVNLVVERKAGLREIVSREVGNEVGAREGQDGSLSKDIGNIIRSEVLRVETRESLQVGGAREMG